MQVLFNTYRSEHVKQTNLFGDPPPKEKQPVRITIPPGSEHATCSSGKCGAHIVWVLTGNNRHMPVDPDGTPHHATCKDVDAFRSK